MYRPLFEKIETASKQELARVIQKTKNKLKKLRDIMENPNYKCTKSPSELTIYKCDKYFLDMAIMRYLSIGGEYVYSEKELDDIEFNDRLEDIVKISLMNGSWFDNEPHVIIDTSNNKLAYKVFTGADYVEMDVDLDKESFLRELGELHLGEWDKDYSPERFCVSCLDGTKWELKVEYKDGSSVEFSGRNAYPL